MSDAPASSTFIPRDDEQHTSLLDLVQEVNRGASREEVFSLVADALRQVFSIDRFAIVLMQPDGSLALTTSGGLSSEYLAVVHAGLSEGAGARALSQRRPLYIHDAGEDPEFRPFQEAARREGFHTVLIWPLFAGAEPLGYLIMYHDNVRDYTPAEVMLAQALVQQAAYAVQHERLWAIAEAHRAELEQRFQQRVAEADAIDHIVLQVSASLDLASTLHSIVEVSARLSSSQTAGLYLRDEGGTFTAMAAFGVPLERLQRVTLTTADGLLAQMSRTGQPAQAINFAEEVETTLAAQQEVERIGVHATLGVPMMENDQCVGALYVGGLAQREYSAESVRTMRRLCDFAHVALQNARRYTALAAERSRLQAYLDAIPQGIAVFDRTGAVLLMNQTMLEHTGLEAMRSGLSRADIVYAPQRIADRNMAFWFDPDELFTHVLTSGAPQHGLVEIESPRQTLEMHFSALPAPDGGIGGIVLAIRDITSPLELERERERSSLLAQLLDLSSVLNSNQDVAFLSERVVEAAMKLVGAMAGTLGLIEGDQLVFRRYHLPDGWTDFPVILNRGEGVPGMVWQTMEPYSSNDAENDPRVFPTIQQEYGFKKLAFVPVINREGRLIGTLGVYDLETGGDFRRQDVESLLLLAQQAAIAIENARLNQQRDNFLSIVSHELKTPVTSIKGFAQVLARRTPPEALANTQRYLDIINHQADRLTSLINDLLDLGRLRTGKLTFTLHTFDYSALLDEVIVETQISTPDNRVELDVPPGLIITANAERLRQVVTNLLNNAFTHGPSGGTVSLAVQLTAEQIITTVTDDGGGLPAGEEARIFAPYYQVRPSSDRTARGLGMGLFISRRIVEEHGGKIWVESGERTRFTFTLPRQAQIRAPE